MKKLNILYILCFLITSVAMAQPAANKVVIDEVVAVVGNIPILKSDIHNLVAQSKTEGMGPKDNCYALEEMLFQKLLVNQAQLDSVEINDKQVEQELDKRLRYYIGQFGSQDRLEEFYNKPLAEIKDEFRPLVKEQILAQTMQGKIVNDLKVTPGEIRSFYNSIPVDSLPLINSEIEVCQIVKMPPISEEEKKNTKEKLEKIRQRIVNGEDFSTLAVLYSEDPGSASKGGELGMMGRGQLVPEFEATAFELKGKEVSRIIETQFGYHIIQQIERRGEMMNCRHILLIPKVNPSDLYKASQKLDTVYSILKTDTITFEQAVLRYSDDAETKYNSGLMVNPGTGTTRFEMDELDQQTFFVVDKLNVGEFSRPVRMQTSDGKQAYRILYLRTKTEPHRANLKEDYQRIQNIALLEKQNKAVSAWIKKKKNSVYIQVDPEYKKCNFKNEWF